MDPPGYEPRVLKGMGLAYATSDRGACHLRSTFYKPELAGIIAPEQIEGKAALFTEWEDRLTLQDGLILCRFFRDLYLWEEFAAMICGTLGLELNKADLRRIAGNILNLAHEYNLREGVGPSDDILPNRLLQEPLTDSGKSLPKSELQQMVSEYHSLRGWKE
jgi:aldehyde:ferredoxin oxidoreductase